VPATEFHGHYIVSSVGNTIADFYTMSHPAEASVLNGGRSKPVHFLHEMAEHNCRLAAATPDLLEAAKKALNYIANTEGELGIKLDSGDALRAAIARAEGR
jgi:hypothetical protein